MSNNRLSCNVISSFCKLLGLALAFSSAATAAPTVNGTTISWPDDGWYQVQQADNYQSICNGGRSCNVSIGNYIVINHNTGERFDINVASNAAPVTAVSVNGQTISWPNDGWYQVQRADTYQSVCNGGSECSVASGTYIVINHSTGDRNEVTVQSSSEPEAPTPSQTSIAVSSDNVISWPDDGWYEVQSAATYQSVCSGGRSCAVEAGTYNVINHTIGKRFDGIKANGSKIPAAKPSSPATTVNVPKTKWTYTPDGRWSTRSDPWEYHGHWKAADGNLLKIDSQVLGPLSNDPATASGGAQWAVMYSETHLQLIILGPEDGAESVSLFLDTDNSKGAEYDGVNDYHITIPVRNRSGNYWENNDSKDADGYLVYGDNSAILDASAIEFATCTCGGRNPLWEINIDLAKANIATGKAFGFDVRVNNISNTNYGFGWADGTNANQAMPANMGMMILVTE